MGLKKFPTLLTEEQITKRVREMGAKITQDYKGESIICVGVLKGSVIFFSDLIRSIDLPLEIDFLGASSYLDQTTSSGIVQITHDLSVSITDRHVLVVEDIVDTGNTLHYLLEGLRLKKPASLKLCALLHKPMATKKAVDIDYLGFSIENKFVVGYGLDFAGKHRNIPYVAIYPGKEN